jgi:hypothetical protein
VLKSTTTVRWNHQPPGLTQQARVLGARNGHQLCGRGASRAGMSPPGRWARLNLLWLMVMSEISAVNRIRTPIWSIVITCMLDSAEYEPDVSVFLGNYPGRARIC